MPNPTNEITIPQLQFNNAVAVNISSTNHQSAHPACLYVGTAGVVVVDAVGIGTQVSIKAVAGLLPLFVTKVYKDNTAAQDMLFLN